MEVLVVDDNKFDNQKLAASFPQDSVSSARNLQDAARILNEAKRWPDLVVVDAMFPMDSNSPPAFMVGAFLDMLENVSARKEQALPDVILVSG